MHLSRLFTSAASPPAGGLSRWRGMIRAALRPTGLLSPTGAHGRTPPTPPARSAPPTPPTHRAPGQPPGSVRLQALGAAQRLETLRGQRGRRVLGVVRRCLWALPACLLLSGCGWVNLAYPRLPDLGLLYVQRQVSLNGAQTEQLRQDLRNLLAWHRSTQLQPTADLLRRWHTLATTEFSAEQVCQEADSVRRLLDATVPQALPALVRLAQSLNAEQRQALQASQRRSLDEFREAHLGARPSRSWLPSARAASAAHTEATAAAPTPTSTAAVRAASLEARFDAATGRYEMLYGALNPEQRQALRDSLARSSFDAPRLLAERERRTQDLLQAVADTATAAPGAESAPLRGWIDRLQASPTPGHTAYGQTLQQEGCAQMATLHRLATAEQRQKAANTLAGHEAALRQLARP